VKVGRSTWAGTTIIAVAASVLSMLATSAVAHGSGPADVPRYDANTAVILARLKELDEKVSDIWTTVHYTKGYLKGHHAFVAGKMYRLARRGWYASQKACEDVDLLFYLEVGSSNGSCAPDDLPANVPLLKEP
jgi:hypothetical protein